MPKLRLISLIFLSFFLCFFFQNDFLFAETETKIPTKENNLEHIYWIELDPPEISYEQAISRENILKAQVSSKPDLIITGELRLKYSNSAEKCTVRLANDYLFASKADESPESDRNKIKIMLRGIIGDKNLSTKFVKPKFDWNNEVKFTIEGYIDPSSYSNGLEPGSYNYMKDFELIVKFED